MPAIIPRTTYRLTNMGWNFYRKYSGDLTHRHADVGTYMMMGAIARSLGLGIYKSEQYYDHGARNRMRGRESRRVPSNLAYSSDDIDLAGLGWELSLLSAQAENKEEGFAVTAKDSEVYGGMAGRFAELAPVMLQWGTKFNNQSGLFQAAAMPEDINTLDGYKQQVQKQEDAGSKPRAKRKPSTTTRQASDHVVMNRTAKASKSTDPHPIRTLSAYSPALAEYIDAQTANRKNRSLATFAAYNDRRGDVDAVKLESIINPKPKGEPHRIVRRFDREETPISTADVITGFAIKYLLEHNQN